MTLNSGILFGRIEIDTVKEKIFISNIDKRALDEIETMIHEIMSNNKKNEKAA